MPRSDRASGAFTRRFVAVVRHPIEAFFRSFFDLEITGREHLPQGPCVIACNHLSFIDPVIATLVAERNIRYLAVATLFDTHHLFDRLLSFFGTIPTPRDAVPIAAVRTALEELRADRPVGVFPEGRRVEGWRAETPKRGAAWLAMATGTPVVPVAMEGSQGTLSLRHSAFRRTPLRVWVEPPLDPDDYLDRIDPLGAIMDDWMDAIGRRLDPWWPGEVAAVEATSTETGGSRP